MNKMNSDIKEENFNLIKNCLAFYADEKSYDDLIQQDKGSLARNTIELINKINKENDHSEFEDFKNFDPLNAEKEFLKQIDKYAEGL